MERYSYSSCTHAGLVRSGNQDNLLLALLPGEPAFALLAVADGMGGYEGGEVASELAVRVVAEALRRGPIDWQRPEGVLEQIRTAMAAANAAIVDQQQQPPFERMGTTLTLALIQGSELYLGHCGDSRAYLVKAGRVVQLTADHSVVGELVRNGGLTEAEAMTHPQRNLLTSALGAQGEPQVDLLATAWDQGDVLILCTDGLTSLVTADEMVAAVAAAAPFDGLAAALVSLANDRGGHDNITVVAARREVSNP